MAGGINGPISNGQKKEKKTFKGKTSYMCFKDDVYKKLASENPDKPSKEIIKLIGE